MASPTGRRSGESMAGRSRGASDRPGSSLTSEGGWTRRRGRPRDGALDERAAHAAALQAIDRVGEEVAERLRRERQAAERAVTVRELAHEWLEWLRDVKRVKPATLRDYESLLREPGTPYPRGTRVSAGRLLAAFGDTPIHDVRTRDVSAFLRGLDAEGLTPRNVNKHRQVLGSVFQYACREDTYDLPVNPVARTDKRPEPPPAALDYYEEHEVDALVETIAAGRHRTRERDALDERIDAQDAEMLRVLFYTGIRLGEAVVLRWDDVDLERADALHPSRAVCRRRGAPEGPSLPHRAAGAARRRGAAPAAAPRRVPRAGRLRVH